MINLLPPNMLLDKQIARSNTILRRYVQLMLISMLVIGASVVAASYFLTSQRDSVKETVALNVEKSARLAPIQKQGEELSATVTTISSLFSRNISFSDMLTKIGSVTPSGTVLTGLQFSTEDFESPLIITARIESAERGAVLRNNLASSDLFSRADIQSISQTEGADTSSVPTAPGPDGQPAPDLAKQEKYRFTVVINAYFKNDSEKKKS